MASGRLGDYNQIIRERPEVKILVYFALLLLMVTIPFVYVGSRSMSTSAHDIAVEGIFATAAVIAVLVMQHLPNALPLSSHGFTFRGIVIQTAIGAAIGLALMSAIVNTLQLSGHYVADRENIAFAPIPGLALFFLVAVFEETVFRGFIFATLEHKWGSFVALTTTCLLFGLAHLVDAVPGISFAQHLRASLFIGLEAGLLLNASFMLTRSLWLGIGIHWAWNFFEGPFYGTNVSGLVEPAPLYQSHTIGPAFITGGAFGPENGIVCLIIATIAGLVMLRLAIRAGRWQKNPEIDAETL
jgi:membrane protease YdiL (CAAX protease family)